MKRTKESRKNIGEIPSRNPKKQIERSIKYQMIGHNNFQDILQSELYELNKFRQKLLAALENTPEGSLHVLQKQGKNPEYYLYDDRKKRNYISQKNKITATKLAQKEYDLKLLAEINARIKAGQELEQVYKIPLQQAYDSMHKAKQILVTPYESSDQEYIKKWYEKNQGGMNTYSILTNLYSNKGEHLRSKSEKIIADLFGKYDIPYVYEPKIVFENGYSINPDFLILNVRLRKTFIYEHFGLMSDKTYAEKTNEKINLYMANNYMPGKNFLFTMESQTEPLNTKIIKNIIETYLL